MIAFRRFRPWRTLGALALVTPFLLPQRASAQEDTVRLRDVATIGGQMTRRVMGYGLVVGLEGTGDQSWGATAASGAGGSPSVRSIMNLLRRFQIDLPANSLRLRNVAAVMVTAEVPPFARPGASFPVQVASIGDATSLAGGTLLMAPLLSEVGGEPVATAQGPLPLPAEDGQRRIGAGRARFGPVRLALSTGGQVGPGWTAPPSPGARIPIYLKSADPMTALAIERRLREWAGDSAAAMVDPGTVEFFPPDTNLAGRIRWMATADTLSLELPAGDARILWDMRAKILVAGGQTPIRPGALQVKGIQADIRDEAGKAPRTVESLVRALQRAGASGNDVGEVLQAMAQAGLLRAKVIIQ